ncbi:MAG: carotenoid oxygenase family protein [Ilumatobacteraceae bacterium]
MTAALSLVDMSTEPFLSGRFAPIDDEITADDLVVEGTLPTDLLGALPAQRAEPGVTPLGSYTSLLEGDGMLHGVWFEGGRAHYANRRVRTHSLLAGERAGRALFGGIMRRACRPTRSTRRRRPPAVASTGTADSPPASALIRSSIR